MEEINELRRDGCLCGGEYMKPTHDLMWDDQLYLVSRDYARYMDKYNHFDHFSRNGEDIGDRLDKIGYKWYRVGENLGRGYDDFYSVFKAWIASPSHCKMLMDPHVKFIGMSKYNHYWAQSFALPLEAMTYSN